MKIRRIGDIKKKTFLYPVVVVVAEEEGEGSRQRSGWWYGATQSSYLDTKWWVWCSSRKMTSELNSCRPAGGGGDPQTHIPHDNNQQPVARQGHVKQASVPLPGFVHDRPHNTSGIPCDVQPLVGEALLRLPRVHLCQEERGPKLAPSDPPLQEAAVPTQKAWGWDRGAPWSSPE